jgi:glycosyltransferase involved in cell wall biosynthesis
MRILIDLQACQTPSRNRGIGRLSLALARAMASIGNHHEFWLLLNEAFPETIPDIHREFDTLISRERIAVFAAGRRRSNWNFFRSRPQSQLSTRDEAIAAIAPDVIHIASFFDSGESPIRGDEIPTAVTLYDLIPLLHAQRYFGSDPAAGTRYHNKVRELGRASLLLAISNFTRSEAIEHLGMAAGKIVTIDAGPDPCFRTIALAPEEERKVRTRTGLTRPFVMYTAGIDWRKNVSGLIESFALLPPALRMNYQLAIVCAVKPTEAAKLLDLARRLGLGNGDVVFTDFVTDEDLVKLYNLCHLFAFPSLHEGFGLPIVEAMACGAPVIGSNVSSIPEIIGCPDALFDPVHPAAIAEAMAAVLTNEEFRQSLRRHGLVQARRFTWENSARRALSALETLVNQ